MSLNKIDIKEIKEGKKSLLKFVGYLLGFAITTFYLNHLFISSLWLILMPMYLLLMWVIFKRFIQAKEKIW